MATDAEKMPALASRRANACLAPQRVLQFWCVVVACTLAAGSLGKTTGSGTAQGGGAARVVRGPGAGPTREVLVDSHRPHQDSAVAAAAVSAAAKRNPESRFSRQVRVWVDRLAALRWLGVGDWPVRAEAHDPRGPCSATDQNLTRKGQRRMGAVVLGACRLHAAGKERHAGGAPCGRGARTRWPRRRRAPAREPL